MWLAYDIGTTGTKAALVDDSGDVVATAYQDYETNRREGGVVEQHVQDWLQAVITTTHDLAPENITGIAITGQMQDIILLDANGDPTHPVVLYSDTRAKKEAAQYKNWVNIDVLRAETGNKQGEGADGLGAKLVWLAHNAPGAMNKTEYIFIGAADYIAYQMTDAVVTDSTTASTTGLMHMNSRQLLRTELLPREIHPHLDKLAQIVPGGARAGHLTERAAQALGLPAGVPVHIGPGDAGATSFGVGSNELGQVSAYLGTSGWVSFASENIADFSNGVITLAHPDPDLHIQVAPLLTAGGNLEQALVMFDAKNYDDLLRRAADHPVDVLYLPYLNGERSPFVDPLARATFIGIDNQTSNSTLIRALLTGVAYGYRHALDELDDVPVDKLMMTGGGTKSGLWMQIFADVLGTSVNVLQDAENIGVRGAVAAARKATFDAPIARTYQPTRTHRDHYNQQYSAFKQAYPALKPVFEALAKS